jgi:hypothetical protein
MNKMSMPELEPLLLERQRDGEPDRLRARWPIASCSEGTARVE